MKGIYLTEEAKAEIEAKIAEIEAYEGPESGMADDLKKILSSATILPVEKDYCYIQEKYFDEIKKDDSPDTKLVEILQENFKNGVIIQPKQ